MATTSNPTSPSCCNSGFSAAAGWDPVTGWGSVPFTKFASIFSVAAPFIPAAPKGAAAVSQDIPVEQIVTLVLVLLVVLGSALTCVYYCARKNSAMRACLGLPPLVSAAQFQNNQSLQQQHQQQQEWEQRWDNEISPRPAMATATWAGQGQGLPVMAHDFPQTQASFAQSGAPHLRPVSVGPVSFARQSFPDPPAPYTQPYPLASSSSSVHGGTFVGPPPFVVGPPRKNGPAIYGFEPDHELHAADIYAHQPQQGNQLEACPHCGMGFHDPVDLVEHVQVCEVPDA